MPRAAPGVDAWGVVRRKILNYSLVPGDCSGRRQDKRLYRSGMEFCLHPPGRNNPLIGCFTLPLSDFGVGGRLGEVVSLVGDCRPPPPGNPHQPPNPNRVGDWMGEKAESSRKKLRRSTQYLNLTRSLGGIIFLIQMNVSFNSIIKVGNLKILKSFEYFKEKRSYFSCTENVPVLEFGSFHSHLCGRLEVKPLSIAITNVLEL